MRLSRPLLTTIALVVAAIGTNVHAQSLQELYEAARAYDATYLAAKSVAQAAEYRAAQVDALGRPRASLGASATQARNYPDQVLSSVVTGAGVQVVRGPNSSAANAALNGSYPLYNQNNRVAIQQAQRSLDAAAADLETAEQDLIVRLAQAYFDVLTAQEALTITRAAKVAITEQLASAKRNFEVGTATITDTRESQARFDLATAQEIAADNDLRAKRIALDQLVGRSGVAPKGLAAPVVLPPTVPANPDDWVSRADAEHPLIQRARAGYDVAKLETERARAANSPTLDAVGSLSNNQAGPSFGDLTSKSTASVGLLFNMPLYTGGLNENRIKEALSLEEKSRNDLDGTQRGVAQATRTAYFGVQSGIAQVTALEAAESSTKLALEATRLGFKVGIRVNLDVLNAERDLFQTQFDLAKARYAVLLGSLKLRQAAGLLKGDDVRALSQVLAK
jgi:outer membrane protein